MNMKFCILKKAANGIIFIVSPFGTIGQVDDDSFNAVVKACNDVISLDICSKIKTDGEIKLIQINDKMNSFMDVLAELDMTTSIVEGFLTIPVNIDDIVNNVEPTDVK